MRCFLFVGPFLFSSFFFSSFGYRCRRIQNNCIHTLEQRLQIGRVARQKRMQKRFSCFVRIIFNHNIFKAFCKTFTTNYVKDTSIYFLGWKQKWAIFVSDEFGFCYFLAAAAMWLFCVCWLIIIIFWRRCEVSRLKRIRVEFGWEKGPTDTHPMVIETMV